MFIQAGSYPLCFYWHQSKKNKMKTQKLESKIGEVKYRKKLTKQYLGKNKFFSNEPDTKEIISALKDRISSTKNDFVSLKKQGVNSTPYLEIGAEFGHRASILEEKYNSKGSVLMLTICHFLIILLSLFFVIKHSTIFQTHLQSLGKFTVC